jgi:hypothetical protein
MKAVQALLTALDAQIASSAKLGFEFIPTGFQPTSMVSELRPDERDRVGKNTFVTEGSVELFLHEAAHFISALPAERRRTNFELDTLVYKSYGLTKKDQNTFFNLTAVKTHNSINVTLPSAVPKDAVRLSHVREAQAVLVEFQARIEAGNPDWSIEEILDSQDSEFDTNECIRLHPMLTRDTDSLPKWLTSGLTRAKKHHAYPLLVEAMREFYRFPHACFDDLFTYHVE